MNEWDKLKVPTYLPDKSRDRFVSLAGILLQFTDFSVLDADLLAKYITAENEYITATNKIMLAMSANDPDAATKWMSVQDKVFDRIVNIGKILSITPDVRRGKKIVMPKPDISDLGQCIFLRCEVEKIAKFRLPSCGSENYNNSERRAGGLPGVRAEDADADRARDEAHKLPAFLPAVQAKLNREYTARARTRARALEPESEPVRT